MGAVGRLGEIDSKLERCFADWVNSLIGQILMRAFHDVEIAGFYYENPATDLSDDENFVQVRVSDDDGILSGDGENDDGGCLTSDDGNNDDRSHSDDDRDIHGNFYHLHGDENVDNRSQDDGDYESRGSICHLCICVRGNKSHGHNDNDHNSGTGDDDEENDHDDDFAGVNIDHGHCRQRV